MGYYQRDQVTTSGRLEDLNVPRDREGQFHTQVFERYRRYEPQVAQGLTEMFVAGTSTHKVGEVAQTLMGVAPSASAISRLNQDSESSNSSPGGSARCKHTGAFSIWMGSILAYGTATRPMQP